MATTMESPGLFPDSPFEQEDVIYPCKACGDILEEGKAYELAGNRWHIDCFRCNTCGTLLDSDANLLLLGDGSLICNNCTYSCNACGNKIEDLAILTGDQAFCSGCFRCRNCKRKIENLRYARTSQGIFCMSCHESLMARRRKKSKTSTKSGQGSASTTKEKALPSLPSATGPPPALTPGVESPPVETPDSAGAVSPSERQYKSPKSPRPTDGSKNISAKSDDARAGASTLPASTYDDARTPQALQGAEDNEEEGFLPMAFDPNPAPGPPPIARKQVPPPQDGSSPPPSDARPSRDYFNRIPPKSAYRDKLRDDVGSASPGPTSTDRERDRAMSNGAHILYQEKGRSNKREPSTSDVPLASDAAFASLANSAERDQGQSTLQSEKTSIPSRQDDVKIGEIPLTQRAGSRTSSKADARSPVSPTERPGREGKASPASPGSQESPRIGVNHFDDPRRRADLATATSKQAERPVRGDSLTAGARRHLPTPEPPTPTLSSTASFLQSQERKSSNASLPSSYMDVPTTLSRDTSRSKVTESPRIPGSFDSPPPRSSSRPGATARSATTDETIAPRTQPRSSPYTFAVSHRPAGSVSSLDGIGRSPTLPHDSVDGTFSMEEEMSRIMRGEGKKDVQASDPNSAVLRKVSSAVKHGRSHSDRGLSSAGRASANGAAGTSTPVSISSPILSTFSGNEGPESLMAQLRRAHQRIAELETANAALQEKVNSSSEIKAANNELREKRTTIVVLDTQREMVVRELEAMTDHLNKAKNSNQPLDLNALKGDVVKDFATSLQRLKDQMSVQIEELMHKRNELTDEISNLIQMKDKGFQEYESLSSKNAQLLEMNNQILQNIQEMYKSNRTNNGATNGLGIYNPATRSDSSGPSELRNLNLINTDSSMPNLLQETEADSATVLNAPQVVNIRKAQPKRFNWRRGGEKVAKGIKGAFSKEEYGQTLGAPGSDQYVVGGRQGSDAGKAGAGFGFFGQKGSTLRPGIEQLKSSGSSTNLVADASVLFGSELDARCDYEKRVVPAIVSRCIDEVEARGMNMEGIYRKSGGSGQVKQVQQGFEKDSSYDISDEDLDIHAVTSALKQYFRKLPTPLITYEVYDSLLDAGRLTDLEKQSVALRLAVAELPEPHRNCLEYLFQHLARVVSHQSENLMTPLNLAVVFAPTIMRPLSIEREMSDMQAQRAAVQALLEQHETVFAEEE